MTRRRKTKGKAKMALAADIGMLEVDNPGYEAGHPGSIRRVVVPRSLRDDPLGQMHDRAQITEPQYRAGRQVQADYELSGQGRIAGQDTTREPVDGGGYLRMPVTDSQIAAGRRLDRWRSTLGESGWAVCSAVLIDKRTVREMTQLYYGEASPANLKYAGRRFRECLDILAKRMGLVTGT